MIVTGWKAGSPNNRTGGGYGIRLTRRDRDIYFQKWWPAVDIELSGVGPVEVNLSRSFWKNCIELRSAAIGKWMLDRGLAPWLKGNPPRLQLEPCGDRRFRLIPA